MTRLKRNTVYLLYGYRYPQNKYKYSGWCHIALYHNFSSLKNHIKAHKHMYSKFAYIELDYNLDQDPDYPPYPNILSNDLHFIEV